MSTSQSPVSGGTGMWNIEDRHMMVPVRKKFSDTLTKSLPRPAFEKHKEYMVGTEYLSQLFMLVL